MSQVYVPGGEYRLHTGPMEMAVGRIANRFGVRGLAGEQDPRSIPARGPTVVLPLVRGRDGWFYLRGDDHRAQTRAMSGLGYTVDQVKALQANFPASSADYKILQDLIDNPALLASDIGQNQLAGVLGTAQAGVQAQQNPTYLYTDSGGVQRTGTTVPAGATNVKVLGSDLPGTINWNVASVTALTDQERASQVTGKPNQSVPPRSTAVTLPTGTGASGGNPFLGEPGGIAGTPPSHGGLILLLIGGGLLYMMGRH